MVISTRDHASDCPSEGCVAFNRDELVLQFHRWDGHPMAARSHYVEAVSHAWILLRVQFHCRLFP